MGTYRGPNYYPPGGHDWVATDVIRKETAHTEALLAEKYMHDVMTFRRTFFGKLAAHQAINDGFGWATFNGEGVGGSVATVGQSEVLLMSRARIEAPEVYGCLTPFIRILTNEPIVHEGDYFYLTEDITLDEDGAAQYLLDAIQMTSSQADLTAEQHGVALMQSFSPLFLVDSENRLHISRNLQEVTPIFTVTFPNDNNRAVTPFGYPNVTEDKIYALSRANELLASVLELDPTYSSHS